VLYNHFNVKPGTVVSKETSLRTGRYGVRIEARVRDFLFSTKSRPALGSA